MSASLRKAVEAVAVCDASGIVLSSSPDDATSESDGECCGVPSWSTGDDT